VRYRIEYFVETTNEHSVCHFGDIDGDLYRVELQARLDGERLRKALQIAGFQIRDLTDGGRIVAFETFGDPLGHIWPNSGNHVVH
jgi:hypothetical protein